MRGEVAALVTAPLHKEALAALEVRAQFGALPAQFLRTSLTPSPRPLQDRVLRGADALLRPANGAPPALPQPAPPLLFVSAELRGDSVVVLVAVYVFFMVLYYASAEVRGDREVEKEPLTQKRKTI